MFQIQTKAEGEMIHGAREQYWMSPQRDLAHLGPVLIQKALKMTMHPTEPVICNMREAHQIGEEALEDAAKKLADFVRLAAERREATAQEIAEESGWIQVPAEIKTLIGYCIGIVTLSAFVQSMHEALRGSFKPFLLGGPGDLWH